MMSKRDYENLANVLAVTINNADADDPLGERAIDLANRIIADIATMYHERSDRFNVRTFVTYLARICPTVREDDIAFLLHDNGITLR